MQTISPEVQELFDDPDFEAILKTLASEFGEDITLNKLNKFYQKNKPVPHKDINGKDCAAGYTGRYMVREGHHKATLVDVKQNGPNCKLMFLMEPPPASDCDAVFIYHNLPKETLKVEQIVRLGKAINDDFAVYVKHDTIPQTGDKHALIERVEGLDLLLK